ncbi:response regulator [Desulfopila sp. IMCC35006]|uniref:hybrid sensor histidine kinase/response regulator n=1 Tax=Desulfopila sp. IMCC35006 TaxID=2569542 RepID=UPI0010AB783D|nr:response regulator [Desulfopila sp. IMCC35006]TKB23153.1 response regulator [Desulfopila sp. IMCC35006]
MANNSFFLQSWIDTVSKRLFDNKKFDDNSIRKSLMYGISSVGIIFLVILGGIAVVQGGVLLATLDFSAALLLLGLLFLLRIKGYLDLCIKTGVTAMFFLYLYLVISGGITGTAFLWSYTYPLFAFFLLGSKKGFWYSSAYFLSCLTVMIVDLNSSMINLYDMNLVLRFIPSFAVVILFSLIYEKYRESTHQALMELKDNLEKKVVARTGELLTEVQNRKAKENDLRVSEARYRTLYDNSSDGISIITLDGHFSSANKQLCDRLGYTEEELKTKRPEDIYTKGSGGEIKSLFKKAIDIGSADLEAEQIARSGDHIPVEIRAQLIVIDNKDAILCSCRDITERKKQEEENRNLQEQLHRSSKMEAIGLMAGGIAHDLNNILSGVTGYPELMLLSLPPDSPLIKPLKAVLESGRRAAAVVTELLTMARGVASVKQPHDCNNLIEEFLATPEAIKITENHPNVAIITRFAKATGSIICSPIHIQKCIMNLLINAVEAVENKGMAWVEIETDRPNLSDDTFEKLNLRPGDYVRILVKDNGSGISSQDVKKIFEPFYSKKILGRSGTGLGLTVVWSVVDEHHGAVDVDSSGQGTIFTLYLPATDSIEIKNSHNSPQQEDQASGHILVVDDEPQLRDLASTMLETFGYTTKTVNSGEEAIAVMQNETFDVVLIDMMMEPGMNGRQTYEKIIKINPGQKALIASGYSENQDVKRALALGAGGFIKKPYSMRELFMAIQSVILQSHNTK